MPYLLRCRCGQVQGEVGSPRSAGRALCYCKDCQAFARFLGRQDEMLDDRGGTMIFATVPRHLRFMHGLEQLQCMSLSERGLLRWYAGCCRTAIGNTPRDPRIAYVGLVRTCLPGSDVGLEQAFGPLRIALNTESATGPVRSTRMASLLGLLKIMRSVIGARLSGRYRENPFFDAGHPIRTPHTLAPAERRALRTKA